MENTETSNKMSDQQPEPENLPPAGEGDQPDSENESPPDELSDGDYRTLYTINEETDDTGESIESLKTDELLPDFSKCDGNLSSEAAGPASDGEVVASSGDVAGRNLVAQGNEHRPPRRRAQRFGARLAFILILVLLMEYSPFSLLEKIIAFFVIYPAFFGIYDKFWPE